MTFIFHIKAKQPSVWGTSLHSRFPRTRNVWLHTDLINHFQYVALTYKKAKDDANSHKLTEEVEYLVNSSSTLTMTVSLQVQRNIHTNSEVIYMKYMWLVLTSLKFYICLHFFLLSLDNLTSCFTKSISVKADRLNNISCFNLKVVFSNTLPFVVDLWPSPCFIACGWTGGWVHGNPVSDEPLV